MVAWTNAPRAPELAMVQPEAAGDVPFGPVSWYGVARPCALSGLAGTMMSQLALSVAAACAAGADAAAEALPDGQGAGAAEAAAAGALAPAAGALAAGAAALAPAAAAAGALAPAAGAPAAGVAASSSALAAAEAQEPRADCWIVVVLPLETARMIPRVRPSAIGMARGTAIRAARLFPRRRPADRCPLSIQSTSMWKSPVHAPGASP